MTPFNASDVPAKHMADGMRDYVMRGLQPGSFGTALLSNDLAGAVGSADFYNRDLIPQWVEWMVSRLPAGCWGTPAKVRAWCERGGLMGQQP